MPLVGVIESGTVGKILRSVRYAKADVLILFERDKESAHILFEKGELVMALLGDLKGEEATAALEQWTSGHYSLLKRAQKEAETKGHVLLNGIALKTRRKIERWLKQEGYATSIIGYPQHTLQVITYIQPEVVLMYCPREIGLSCVELTEQLKERLDIPPLLVVLESPQHPCPERLPECVVVPGTVARIQRLLSKPAPGTRFGVRRASRERTAKIYRPEPLPPVPKALAALQDEDAMDPEELTARDLLPMLVVLLVGSGLIWGAWWLLQLQ